MKFDGKNLSDGGKIVANVTGINASKMTVGRGKNSIIVYDGRNWYIKAYSVCPRR